MTIQLHARRPCFQATREYSRLYCTLVFYLENKFFFPNLTTKKSGSICSQICIFLYLLSVYNPRRHYPSGENIPISVWCGFRWEEKKLIHIWFGGTLNVVSFYFGTFFCSKSFSEEGLIKLSKFYFIFFEVFFYSTIGWLNWCPCASFVFL